MLHTEVVRELAEAIGAAEGAEDRIQFVQCCTR
jgi:hypothetical protein